MTDHIKLSKNLTALLKRHGVQQWMLTLVFTDKSKQVRTGVITSWQTSHAFNNVQDAMMDALKEHAPETGADYSPLKK